MLCSASEIQFGPEKIPAYGWKSAFCVFFCLNKVILLVFIVPPNYTTDIFFLKMQMLNICSHLKHLWGFFNCDACGNAHNRPACQTLDCTLLWGCCLFLLLNLVHKHMCVVIFNFFEKGVTVYHDMCLKQGYYLFMNSTWRSSEWSSGPSYRDTLHRFIIYQLIFTAASSSSRLWYNPVLSNNSRWISSIAVPTGASLSSASCH